MFDIIIMKKNRTTFCKIKNICKCSVEKYLLENLILDITSSSDTSIDVTAKEFFKTRVIDICEGNKTVNSMLKLCEVVKLEMNNKDSKDLVLCLIDKSRKEIVETWMIQPQTKKFGD
jgi:hypothetical protein